MDQTLQNMRGHSTIAQILIILVISTKALFALEKPCRLGIPLLPSMLTIILSRFQTSRVFFLNNSHTSYTFTLCFCSSYYFIQPFLAYISSFCIPFLSVERCRLIPETIMLLFLDFFLASERFYLLSQRVCLEATVFKDNRHFRIVFRKRQS